MIILYNDNVSGTSWYVIGKCRRRGKILCNATTYFKTEDNLNDKLDYHTWKMILDLTLEEHEVLDYVQWKVVDPPLNGLVARTR